MATSTKLPSRTSTVRMSKSKSTARHTPLNSTNLLVQNVPSLSLRVPQHQLPPLLLPLHPSRMKCMLSINVTVGQSVKASDVAIVLEAMKMENNINCGRDVVVKAVYVQKGDNVLEGADLLLVE